MTNKELRHIAFVMDLKSATTAKQLHGLADEMDRTCEHNVAAPGTGWVLEEKCPVHDRNWVRTNDGRCMRDIEWCCIKDEALPILENETWESTWHACGRTPDTFDQAKSEAWKCAFERAHGRAATFEEWQEVFSTPACHISYRLRHQASGVIIVGEDFFPYDTRDGAF